MTAISNKGEQRVRYKSIDDTTECPHCGSNFGYYRRSYVYGWINDVTIFSTGEKYNSEMYDSLRNGRESKWYYCAECNKKVAKAK